MNDARMIGHSMGNRTVSSGMVFDEQDARSFRIRNAARQNKVLLRLIEEEMELSFRAQNCLDRAGIRLIGQMVQKTAAELLALKNFGRTSLGEIGDKLFEMGLTTGMSFDFPPWCGHRKDAELIRILSHQCIDGGFALNDKGVQELGMDPGRFKAAAFKKSGGRTAGNRLILSTALVLKCLEEKYPEESPYLDSVIQRGRQWLRRQVKEDSIDSLFKQIAS